MRRLISSVPIVLFLLRLDNCNTYYGKHREEVAKRFEKKLSESSLEFIGYCLPDISFENKQFDKAVSFQGATFYEVNFSKTTFLDKANFYYATFSDNARFERAQMSVAYFVKAKFKKQASVVLHFPQYHSTV